jgi:hypothetical protein
MTDPRDWDIWIGALEFAYNDSVHPATGFTPFQLSIGRDPSMPITMLVNGFLQRPALYASDEQFVDPQVFLHKFTTMLTAAKQELRRRQVVQQQALLKRANYPVHYDPGDYVWMEASTLRNPLNTMAPRFHGPYRVIRKVGLNSYELDFGDKSRRHNPINEEKLRPYLDRNTRLPFPTHGVLPNTPAAAARPALPPPPPTPGDVALEGDMGQTAGIPAPAPLRPLPSPASGAEEPPVPGQKKKYVNKQLHNIREWRATESGDTLKAEVLVKYRNEVDPVWRDLHDVLTEGGYKHARAFMSKHGVSHPHLWRTGFKSFQGKSYPFITAEYQLVNTEGEAQHRPYFVVYSDKDHEVMTPQEVQEAEQRQPQELGGLHYAMSKSRRPPRMLELCCGTKSATRALRRLWPGAKIVTLDLDPRHAPSILADVTDWRYGEDVFKPGYFDIIWASPPCTEYSVAKTVGVRDLTSADHLVRAVRRILRFFRPTVWFIENPHGLLYLRPMMRDIEPLRHTTTYCQYGSEYRKETDIWTNAKVQLKHCRDTPCSRVIAFGRHTRTAQSGPCRGVPGTPREQAYQIPFLLLKTLLKAALLQCGYQV